MYPNYVLFTSVLIRGDTAKLVSSNECLIEGDYLYEVITFTNLTKSLRYMFC